MAAPIGNQNALKARLWRDAVLREVARQGGSLADGLAKAAAMLFQHAVNGEQWAVKELGDRIDGKPAQMLIHNGDEDGGPVQVEGRIKLVKPDGGGEGV
jgi:hypothetical protein